MEEKLKSFGFEEELPFDLTMQASTFDDDGRLIRNSACRYRIRAGTGAG